MHARILAPADSKHYLLKWRFKLRLAVKHCWLNAFYANEHLSFKLEHYLGPIETQAYI